jgi:hypothetical protein
VAADSEVAAAAAQTKVGEEATAAGAAGEDSVTFEAVANSSMLAPDVPILLEAWPPLDEMPIYTQEPPEPPIFLTGGPIA